VKLRGLILAAAAAVGGAALWWRKNPSACPYGQRFWVEAPHPFITRPRLRGILDPKPGERILEVGPGTGYYTLDVAEWVRPDGEVDILDLQQEMLDHTMRRADELRLTNINPTQSDATSLPYEDDIYDGAFLVTVLGEIPDQDAALRELARVLKPGGRLVVGELLGDPHYVRLAPLRLRASGAGLSYERRVGSSLGYFARFFKPEGPNPADRSRVRIPTG
jgi:SAM-dependent methyltransferase